MKTQDLYDYAMKTSADAEVIIMLMHEGKAQTRRILPELVAHFREQGYVFRVLATDETERAILARCPANMMLPELTGGIEQ
jgi:peptidoglycan/xylan/chitin deacetylase (PgdA/CDA1 family)